MSEPLPNDVVATIRLPLAIDALIPITNALENAYGDGLLIHTDGNCYVITKPKETRNERLPVLRNRN